MSLCGANFGSPQERHLRFLPASHAILIILFVLVLFSQIGLVRADTNFTLVRVRCAGPTCSTWSLTTPSLPDTGCKSIGASMAYMAGTRDIPALAAALAMAPEASSAYLGGLAVDGATTVQWLWMAPGWRTEGASAFAAGFIDQGGFQSYGNIPWMPGTPASSGGRYVKFVGIGASSGAVQNSDGVETASFYIMCDYNPRAPPQMGNDNEPSNGPSPTTKPVSTSNPAGPGTPSTDPLDAKPDPEPHYWYIGLIVVLGLLVVEGIVLLFCCCCCGGDDGDRNSGANPSSADSDADAGNLSTWGSTRSTSSNCQYSTGRKSSLPPGAMVSPQNATDAPPREGAPIQARRLSRSQSFSSVRSFGDPPIKG